MPLTRFLYKFTGNQFGRLPRGDKKVALQYVNDKIMLKLKSLLGYKVDENISLNSMLVEYFKLEAVVKPAAKKRKDYVYDVSHLNVGERAAFNDAYYPHGIYSSIKAYSFRSGRRFNTTYIQAENRVIVERKS